MIFRYKYR